MLLEDARDLTWMAGSLLLAVPPRKWVQELIDEDEAASFGGVL